MTTPSLTLNNCFSAQIQFSHEVLSKCGVVDPGDMTDEEMVDWTIYELFAIHKEVSEVVDNFDWKRHRAPKGTWKVGAVLKELVDIQKYLWNIFNIWGVNTPEELAALFNDKSDEVRQRWADEKGHILGNNPD